MIFERKDGIVKKSTFFILLIFLVLLTPVGCSNVSNVEVETPNTMPPSIMVDGEIYYDTGSDIPIEVDESAIKTVTSVITGIKLPSKDGEINFPIQDAKYAKINDSEEYVVVMMNEEWVKFEKRTDEITDLKKLIAQKGVIF